MHQDPSDCPEHVWASLGVVSVDGGVARVHTCERCVAWTQEPLNPDHRVDWATTDLGR